MPVSFLTDEQLASFGRYADPPSADDLARYFHLDDADRSLVQRRRGAGHRLGFALQLCTVRYLGTFLDDCLDVPDTVVGVLARQLHIAERDALHYLHAMEVDPKRDLQPPLEVVNAAWQKHVQPDGETIDPRAYLFCTLDRLRAALKRRDVFVATSWRYADPRKGLLSDAEWQAARPVVCRTLGWSSDPQAVSTALSQELDTTYRAVAQRLPDNKAVRIEKKGNKDDLVLSPLDRLEEPPSLIELRAKVQARMPRVDLPEIVLEIAARTGCMDAFTHISERDSRAADLSTSLCAVLIAQATNTGFEPLVRQDVPALRREFRGAGAHGARRLQPEVFRAPPGGDLVQPDVRPVLRPERHSRAWNLAR